LIGAASREELVRRLDEPVDIIGLDTDAGSHRYAGPAGSQPAAPQILVNTTIEMDYSQAVAQVDPKDAIKRRVRASFDLCRIHRRDILPGICFGLRSSTNANAGIA